MQALSVSRGTRTGVWRVFNACRLPRTQKLPWGGPHGRTTGPSLSFGTPLIFPIVFAVVDVYDAITNDRPYGPAQSKAEAPDFIVARSGRYFDPRVVDALLTVAPTLE